METLNNSHIVVVGLGYVGLPIAVALADRFRTTGLDIDQGRIAELEGGFDRTGEIDGSRLKETTLTLMSDPAEVPPADIYIVTVPTPVTEDRRPDLAPVIRASAAIGSMIDPGRPALVVFESTVYPGVTEDLCGPEIERAGGLRRGEHFWLGYSPERINPGDREHTIDRITKVVVGENAWVTDRLAAMYGSITSGGVFRAASIRVAESAKVIENAQRDINIAFMNEITQIFETMDISVWDVLEAARTKWNFLPFHPGLVGGHCIGVDPYYLSHRAQELGHDPEVILAGRRINDAMGDWIAGRLHARRGGRPGRALILGITFKENVPDIRNSKVVDVVEGLRARGHDVVVHDPVADSADLIREYGLFLTEGALSQDYDLVVCAVAHRDYATLSDEAIQALLAPGGLLADVRGIWRDRTLDCDRWTL